MLTTIGTLISFIQKIMDKAYKSQRINSYNYQSRTADPKGLRFAIQRMRWVTCPYHRVHAKIKGRLLGDLLFEKWHKRPTSAYKLYWRLHPKEEQAVTDYYNKLKAKK